VLGFVNLDVLDAKVSKFLLAWGLGAFLVRSFCLEFMGHNGLCSLVVFFVCAGEFRSWVLLI